ncbi:MAG: hypothetical protein R2911_23905 [Caldilineaceae bacterium]
MKILPEQCRRMHRAFTAVRNGLRPALVEFPSDLFGLDVPEPIAYQPAPSLRVGPDPDAVQRVADALAAAEAPVIYAGQGVHYAEAWAELRQLAELLEVPVTTSLGQKLISGKSSAGAGFGRPRHP